MTRRFTLDNWSYVRTSIIRDFLTSDNKQLIFYPPSKHTKKTRQQYVSCVVEFAIPISFSPPLSSTLCRLRCWAVVFVAGSLLAVSSVVGPIATVLPRSVSHYCRTNPNPNLNTAVPCQAPYKRVRYATSVGRLALLEAPTEDGSSPSKRRLGGLCTARRLPKEDKEDKA